MRVWQKQLGGSSCGAAGEQEQELLLLLRTFQEDGGADASNDTIGNGVGEGHDGDGKEGGDGLDGVAPLDVLDVLHHQGAHQDEGGARGVGGDGGQDGGEEEGDEIAEGDLRGPAAQVRVQVKEGRGRQDVAVGALQ